MERRAELNVDKNRFKHCKGRAGMSAKLWPNEAKPVLFRHMSWSLPQHSDTHDQPAIVDLLILLRR